MPPHVVVIGAGFGGLELVKALKRASCRITLIDRANHHTFQPLLYQVAMAGLSPAEIAMPTRSIFRKQANCTVLRANVEGLDLTAKTVALAASEAAPAQALAYDHLVVAAGAQTTYFGHANWAAVAPSLKSLDDAVAIRNRVLAAFEEAERVTDEVMRAALLTFVVIGAGPTGVELAGAIAELARYTLNDEFRSIDPSRARVVLVEAGPRVLPSFAPELSTRAQAQLQELGVEVRTETRVMAITANHVMLGDERLATHTVVWAAGVRGAELLAHMNVPLDKSGRVLVDDHCGVTGHPSAFVIGDAAHFATPAGPLPGVSPVAMQQGRYVAALLQQQWRGQAVSAPFRYVDKGTMATIGRSRAVVQTQRLKLSGFWAWLAWLLLHVYYLIGFRNRFVVLFTWAWSYMTYKRGARLITQPISSAHVAAAQVREERRGA